MWNSQRVNREQGFQSGNIAKLKAKWKTTQREGSVDAKQRSTYGVRAQRSNQQTW